ncbi:MAG: hypothetical protein ACK4N5_19105 [Myxococcales bacterium]
MKLHDAAAIATVCILAAAPASTGAAEEKPATGPALELKLAVPDVAADAPFACTVTIHNPGTKPVLVFPELLRIEVTGKGATLGTFPGPAIPLASDARVVPPNGSAELSFRGRIPPGNFWALDPGTYSARVAYTVTEQDLKQASFAIEQGHLATRGAVLWTGRVESAPVKFRRAGPAATVR